MSWDWVISAVIIIALVLTVWAKASRQTIPELLGDLKERLLDRGEDVQEKLGVDIYD